MEPCSTAHCSLAARNAVRGNIEWNSGKSPISVKGVDIFAVYMFKEKKVRLLKSSEKLEISLEPFNHDLLTVSPVTVVPRKSIQFAPIGLVNMLNTGGAIESVMVVGDESLIRIGVKGSGEMRVFASGNPVSCKIDGVDVEFCYHDQMVTIQVPCPSSPKLSVIEFLF